MPGLIPTHAGKTKPVNNALQGLGAHPHSRGENPKPETTRYPPEGSSPLTRGKPWRLPLQRGPGGLIPTHAGKTSPRRTRRVAPWAHPHSRGENARFGRANPVPLGSSPLTRGKPVDASRPRRPAGLIPTHAGKTNMDVEPSRGSWAHPHSRGENVLRWAQPGLTLGSSPLTRGKPAGTSSITRMEGLIPTHAGKTPDRRSGRRPSRAHPHSRGENSS